MSTLIAMADIANHALTEPRVSLEFASKWFDRAGFALIAGTVAVLLSTIVIVWLGIEKERHWDLLREKAGREITAAQGEAAKANEAAGKAHERAAALEAEAEKARAELATANAEIARANASAAAAGAEAAQANARASQADARAAEANAKALDAQLALAKFKAPRVLEKEQKDSIAAALASPLKVSFAFSATGEEAANLAISLSEMFAGLGWEWIDWPGRSNEIVTRLPGRKTVGWIMMSGIEVQIMDPKLLPLSKSLTTALESVGFESVRPSKTNASLAVVERPMTIKVMIGTKPQ